MMQRCLRALLVLSAAAAGAALVAAQSNTLDIYVLDVEGGNATLFVTPAREAVLVDTGNGGPAAARDAGRIMDAVRDAGISQIDLLVTTHWHGDHMGSLGELATRIPIRHFVDHGANVQPAPAVDDFLQNVYAGLVAKARRTIARPNDLLPLKGIEWRIVTSDGAMLTAPLPGAGAPNPHCAGFVPHTVNPVSGQPVGNTEDERSVGSYITFGRFRALYLGDLPWNNEFALMCPNNRLGAVEFLLVSRHGQHSSSSAALVHAVRPKVAVINNGIRKGGQPETMGVLYSSPGLEGLWQVHVAQLSGAEHAIPRVFAANDAEDPQHSPAHWIKVSAQRDGSFTVTNSRNGFSKRYVTQLPTR